MLDQYRRDFAEFHVASAREHYLFNSGQKNTLEIAPIYERYGALFARESIDRLKRELEQSPEHFQTERASIKRLLAFAVEQFLEDSVKKHTEGISQFEATAIVEWNGRSMTFQDSTVAITTEADTPSRRAIYNKRLEVIEASNGLRSDRLLKLHDTARSLGYSNYINLFEELRNLDYAAISRRAATLVANTEDLYISRLNEALKRETGLSVDDAERSDAMFLLHLSSFDDHFPSDRMLRAYIETMAGLGIKAEEQSNIEIDSERRARKNPRAFCVPISVPDEVKLVIRPSGGQSDYQSLLHESGHAQHFGWMSPQLSPEFKYTGDYALTETYAFLFNHLISDSEWLCVFLGLGDADFVRSVTLARLVTVRRYAAKLDYERRLHAGEEMGRAAALYSDYQATTTKFKTAPAEFLFDLDDSFYSASYLRAWAFEVSLREHLKTRYGPRWWASRRAGDFLKEVWETGNRYTADEMAAQIGIGPIAFDALIDEFNRTLR